jgi:hypothetical protein
MKPFRFLAACAVGAALCLEPSQPAWAQEDSYSRGLRLARASAVAPEDRPRRFVIADTLLGPRREDRAALDNGLQMMASLGMNTLFVRDFGALDTEAPALAARLGMSRGVQAVYQPLNGIDKEGAFFSWSASARDPQTVAKWTREQNGLSRKVGRDPGQVVLFHIADEPGWYFPANLGAISAGADRLNLFHRFLQSKGLQPRDVGAASWGEVRPIPVSQATDLPSRRLYYWSVRYSTEAISDGLRVWTEGLQREFGPQVRTTANWNNLLGRWFVPSPGAKHANNRDVSADAATGAADWLDVGRKRGVTALWSEDWFNDNISQHWTYIADTLRAAHIEAQLAEPLKGPTQVLDRGGAVRVARVGTDAAAPEFGGYVVGLRISSEWGARLKAMSLIGRGAKILQWYTWGPHERFTNGYSKNEAAYPAIASANRLIGRAEDLLYPGRRPLSRVAIVLPQSAYPWDSGAPMPLHLHEIRGLHPALTNNGWPIDFVDETNVARGDLKKRGYAMAFVAAPNLSVRAQQELSGWIENGGTAVFSPGAVAADEYNTPVRILDQARGVRAQVLARHLMNEQSTVRRDVAFSDADWGAAIKVSRPVSPLDVTDARVVATSGGAPVLAHKRFGRGLAISYGFWPGVNYFDAASLGYGPIAHGTNPALTKAVTAPPRLTRLAKPVETGIEGVEAGRLDSSEGTAVVLLNWTKTAQNQVSVLVRNAPNVRTVESIESGRLQVQREGDGVRVRLPLRDADVLMIRP